MREHFVIILTIFLSACGTASQFKSEADDNSLDPNSGSGSQTNDVNEKNIAEESTYSDIATYFVVVADTGLDYPMLHKKMIDLNTNFNIPIDTMGRHYNTTKNLIALPEDDADELYAGDYFPRRFPSANLSLEYLNVYKSEAGEKTIALVTGIYESVRSADSALVILQKTEKKAFKLKADLYIGCMH